MKLPSISLNHATLGDFKNAIRKEWLVTNGLGGYASSTALGINTRKYHGLLVAAMHPPSDRRVCLQKLDEDIVIENDVYRLGTNEFQDGFYPQGHNLLKSLVVSDFPEYFHSADKMEIKKTIFMQKGRNCTVVLYEVVNRNQVDVKFRIFPLANNRGIHIVTKKQESTTPQQTMHKDVLTVDFREPALTLLLRPTEGQYHSDGRWIQGVHYREEASRGESCFDDCYQPGYFEFNVPSDATTRLGLVVTAGEDEKGAGLVSREMPSSISGLEALRRKKSAESLDFLKRICSSMELHSEGEWLSWILLALDSFVVKGSKERERSVIAGYHWFGCWGRDTFVSLPGLLLTTGRFSEAKEVFLSFRDSCDKGLIANCFSEESNEPQRNTVDATLWYVNSVLQYLKCTGDFEFVRKNLWRMLKTIVECHLNGTLHKIHVDRDGLLSHGPQLTWMDAEADGRPVTPRQGKAVEVQALWFNALKTMELLADRFEDSCESENYHRMAEEAKRSFNHEFWNGNGDCLFDAVDGTEKDGSVRPNQILAVSLDFNMLDLTKSEKVVESVRKKLLTSVGIRTLSPNDSRYVGTYSGDRNRRDKAYHNGTVWPWLLGPFTTAYMKVNGHSESDRAFAFDHFLRYLFTTQIYEAGLGTLSEIFDGDTPHLARGCIAQAWSVAEPLRAYFEDILQKRPEYEPRILRV